MGCGWQKKTTKRISSRQQVSASGFAISIGGGGSTAASPNLAGGNPSLSLTPKPAIKPIFWHFLGAFLLTNLNKKNLGKSNCHLGTQRQRNVFCSRGTKNKKKRSTKNKKRKTKKNIWGSTPRQRPLVQILSATQKCLNLTLHAWFWTHPCVCGKFFKIKMPSLISMFICVLLNMNWKISLSIFSFKNLVPSSFILQKLWDRFEKGDVRRWLQGSLVCDRPQSSKTQFPNWFGKRNECGQCPMASGSSSKLPNPGTCGSSPRWSCGQKNQNVGWKKFSKTQEARGREGGKLHTDRSKIARQKMQKKPWKETAIQQKVKQAEMVRIYKPT